MPASGIGRHGVERIAESVADAERDRASAHARGGNREARVPAFPHRAKLREAGSGKQQPHRRVSHPERPQRLELLGELQADGIAGTINLRAAGYADRRILGMWGGLTIVSAVAGRTEPAFAARTTNTA